MSYAQGAKGAAGVGDGGLAGLLSSPDAIAKLALDPSTRGFLNQPDFMAILTDLQKNPDNIGTYLNDRRMMAARAHPASLRTCSEPPLAQPIGTHLKLRCPLLVSAPPTSQLGVRMQCLSVVLGVSVSGGPGDTHMPQAPPPKRQAPPPEPEPEVSGARASPLRRPRRARWPWRIAPCSVRSCMSPGEACKPRGQRGPASRRLLSFESLEAGRSPRFRLQRRRRRPKRPKQQRLKRKTPATRPTRRRRSRRR